MWEYGTDGQFETGGWDELWWGPGAGVGAQLPQTEIDVQSKCVRGWEGDPKRRVPLGALPRACPPGIWMRGGQGRDSALS